MCGSEVGVLADGGSSVETDFTPDERIFAGQTVICETWTSFRDDDWENPTTITTTRWAVCVHRAPDDPDHRVTADVVAFKGISSKGKTEDEALADLARALRTALEEGIDSLTPQASYIIPRNGQIRYLQTAPDPCLGKPVVRQLPADWPYPPEEGY